MIKLDKEAARTVAVVDDKEPSGARAVVIDTFVVGRTIKDAHANVLEVQPMYGYLVDGEFVRHKESRERSIFGETITIQDIDTKKEFTELVDKVSLKGAPRGQFRDEDIEDFLIEKGRIKGSKL